MSSFFGQAGHKLGGEGAREVKRYLVTSLILLILVFLIPWLGSENAPTQASQSQPPQENDVPGEDTEQELPPPDVEVVATGAIDGARIITVLLEGQIVEMDLGSYLVGVVRAEMPASFEIEALKAQAVAARTYTLYKMANGGSERHPDADTCTDITCCKAYSSAAESAALWGDRAAEYEEKIRAAVTQTDGECVLYGGVPALTVFHSSSAGRTMDAQDVWSSALPYLVSVSSPESADTVPGFHSRAAFPAAQLRSILLEALPQAQLTGNASNWFTNMRQQENGTVTALKVGGVEVGGNQLRTILGLRSACFTLAFEGEEVVFYVTGYGHGVGMSQYGANVLAAGGMSYREILEWYYTDTEVKVYEG